MNPEQVCFYTVKSIRRTLSSFCIKTNFCINLKLVLRERETVLPVWGAVHGLVRVDRWPPALNSNKLDGLVLL